MNGHVFVLKSAPLVNAPNVIRWAVNNYKFGNKIEKQRMVDIVMCWDNSSMMSETIARQILDGSIKPEYDDEEGNVRCEVGKLLTTTN
jgi:hypothetical protein